MRFRTPLAVAALVVTMAPRFRAQEPAALATPGFHHLHLNSTNPEAAIDFYTKNFASTAKATFAGQPALKAGRVYVLFTKVNAPAPLKPQSAFWHFGWHVTDERGSLKHYQEIGTNCCRCIREIATARCGSTVIPGRAGADPAGR